MLSTHLLDRVLSMRLATQRLHGSPFSAPEQAIGLLLCVQAQDAPLARWSLGLRLADAGKAAIESSLDAGPIIRTHILRPTWHLVLARDLRWLAALTGPKVIAGLASRHRQLGLEQREVDEAQRRILHLLDERGALTRREIEAMLDDARWQRERLGHVLMRAELQALICSGPMRDRQHTYVVASTRLPAATASDRPSAIRELVLRFFSGHGPASVSHLTRWTTVTQAEVKAALAELGGSLQMTLVAGVPHWHATEAQTPERSQPRALLLPVFDEAFLTYPGSNFPRVEPHPRGDGPHRFAEAGGGVVICGLRDVGWWKRKVSGRRMRITGELSPLISAAQKRQVEAAAEQLAAFADCIPELRFT